jgi:hypothetical protein
MIANGRPTHMNRNPVPSIVLSVSIVCFFAVALYRHDPVRAESPRRSDAGPSVKPREPIKSSPAGIAAVDRDSRPVAGHGRNMVGPALPSAAGPAAPILVGRRDRRESANAADALAGSGAEAEGGRLRRIVSETTGPGSRVSPRPAEPAGRRGPPAEASAQAASASVRLARAPFTIVGEGETIADVARRVYGPGNDDVQWLRRANREVLGGPGEALSAGTVLRTPARSIR